MRTFLFAILFLFSAPAFADIFIEPQVGYSSGEFDLKASVGGISGTETFDVSGLSWGGKAGFYIGPVQIGADYLQTKLKDGDEFDDTSTEIGAILGLRFSFLRIYGGYIFSAKTEDVDEGNGTKVGATFYALENLALSVEYRMVDLDKLSEGGIEVDGEYSATAILLSVPLNFL